VKPETTLEERLLLRSDIATSTVPGREFAYRPRVVLVDDRDVDLVADVLRDAGAKQVHAPVDGIARFEVPPGVDVPDLLARLRGIDGDRTPRVGPSNVLFGLPRFCGWPGSDAEPAPPIELVPGEPGEKGLPGTGVTVVVIDTGLDADASRHPLLRSVEADDPADIDLTVDAEPVDGFVDDQAGHGAFIAGIIRQHAPGARVRVVKALDTQGITDEVAVARAIERAARDGADVINLSLGGYTEDDRAPLAIVAALSRLPRSIAVIAAAGNLASTRVTWPAALKRVVSVGAVDDDGTPASFTNSGWWVDACAPGVDVHSVYVTGDERPDNDDDGQPDHFDGTAFWSGSSFSCARVSASVAVELSARGGTAREAALRLLEDPQARAVPELGVLLG
jgi:subtilisin family serine protease